MSDVVDFSVCGVVEKVFIVKKRLHLRLITDSQVEQLRVLDVMLPVPIRSSFEMLPYDFLLLRQTVNYRYTSSYFDGVAGEESKESRYRLDILSGVCAGRVYVQCISEKTKGAE